MFYCGSEEPQTQRCRFRLSGHGTGNLWLQYFLHVHFGILCTLVFPKMQYSVQITIYTFHYSLLGPHVVPVPVSAPVPITKRFGKWMNELILGISAQFSVFYTSVLHWVQYILTLQHFTDFSIPQSNVLIWCWEWYYEVCVTNLNTMMR